MADENSEGFITLPPGIVDSGTLKRPGPRVERPPKPSTNDIVFIPTVPGAPLATPVTGETATEETTTSGVPQEVDDATRVSTSRHSAPAWRLTLPNSAQSVAVDGALFIGRNPAATADKRSAGLLAVTDPAKTVSKTHALLETTGGELWVHDLSSTNGVAVAAPGEPVVHVDPGTPVRVPAGSDLELGDFVIQVELG